MYVDGNKLVVEEISIEAFSKAQAFYQSVGHSKSILASDRVVVARINHQIVGVGRIAFEEGILVLRGMQVDRSRLKKGIGSKILYELDKIIGSQSCFCIPHDWLVSFYGLIGFGPISVEDAPAHLQTRFNEYLPKYPHLIIMKKKGL